MGRTSVIYLSPSLWVAHLCGMGFDYTVSGMLLPFHHGFFFMSLDVEYLFWYVPVLFFFLSMVVEQLVLTLV